MSNLSNQTSLLVGAQPTKQQLADYVNAISIVNNYAYSITNQSMPVLSQPPANYASFVQSFVPAKQHVLNWSQNIFVNMTQLPKTIEGQAKNMFSMEDTYIKSNLNKLISNPADKTAKKGLSDALKIVDKVIQGQLTTIGSIEKELSAFALNVTKDSTSLSNISAQALAMAGSDKVQIGKLNTTIGQLQENIASSQKLLMAAEMGMGISLFVCLVGVAVCAIGGAGTAIIVIAVAAESASIAGTVIEKNIIKTDANLINADQKLVSTLNQDVILLSALSSQFQGLVKANAAAMNALTQIKNMWINLQTTIGAVSTELTAINTDLTTADYKKALADFKVAETNWNEVVAFASSLAGINYKWQDASKVWYNYDDQAPTPDTGNVNHIVAA
ncbi:MAG: HBL/NHE enterotoxin family protein [Cyclobacteriaceae bacterium]